MDSLRTNSLPDNSLHGCVRQGSMTLAEALALSVEASVLEAKRREQYHLKQKAIEIAKAKWLGHILEAL